MLDLEDYSSVLEMTESNATQIFTDEAWAVWEPLIEAVRPPCSTGCHANHYGCRQQGIRLQCLPGACPVYGGSISDPAQAPECCRLLSTMGLSRPPSSEKPLCSSEGMSCRRNAIRKDHCFIPRYPSPRRQMPIGSKSNRA